MVLLGPGVDDEGRAECPGEFVVGEVDGVAQEFARGRAGHADHAQCAAEDLVGDQHVVVVGDVRDQDAAVSVAVGLGLGVGLEDRAEAVGGAGVVVGAGR